MRKGPLVIASLLTAVVAAQATTQSPQFATGQEQLGLVIPMRDGVRLTADLFLPRQDGRWPTILIRTPYSRKGPGVRNNRFFTQHGYAVLIEDVRGRYGSEGVFGTTERQGPDGDDTINWISEQRWSNGRVAMAGSSFIGMAQWWAALEDNPHLRAISPAVSGDDEYLDRYYSTGGAMKLGHRLEWLVENFKPKNEPRPPLNSYIYHVPLRTADVAALGTALPLWRAALEHPSYDAYWKRLSIREQMDRITLPVLSFGGWFDNYAESDLDAFSRLSKRGQAVETWMGPWAHNLGLRFATRDFGADARIGLRLKQLDWFDRWLKAPAAKETSGFAPVLHLFVMGPNVWREEHEWPLARTEYTRLYLASNRGANSVWGDGVLQWQRISNAQPDHFVYDPRKPVPTIGGAICCDAKALPPGPLDQSPVEARRDVLIYSSARLPEDVEVTGPVRVELYGSTSANDTDFTAKLVDVQPNGTPLLVTDGITRLRYRMSLSKPTFVKRNTPYQINVDAGVTSYVFAANHRVRLEVSSSNFPRFDRNLNSTRPNALETRMPQAQQTIFHEEKYPSAVILPIIPKPRAGRLALSDSDSKSRHHRSRS